jgi:hypothetical protein
LSFDRAAPAAEVAPRPHRPFRRARSARACFFAFTSLDPVMAIRSLHWGESKNAPEYGIGRGFQPTAMSEKTPVDSPIYTGKCPEYFGFLFAQAAIPGRLQGFFG